MGADVRRDRRELSTRALYKTLYKRPATLTRFLHESGAAEPPQRAVAGMGVALPREPGLGTEWIAA